MLKKKIKILDIDHVQMQDLQAMQQENNQLAQQIIQLRNQIHTYKENERLEKTKTKLLLAFGSSLAQSYWINNPLEDLGKPLSDLNVK